MQQVQKATSVHPHWKSEGSWSAVFKYKENSTQQKLKSDISVDLRETRRHASWVIEVKIKERQLKISVQRKSCII